MRARFAAGNSQLSINLRNARETVHPRARMRARVNPSLFAGLHDGDELERRIAVIRQPVDLAIAAKQHVTSQNGVGLVVVGVEAGALVDEVHLAVAGVLMNADRAARLERDGGRVRELAVQLIA